eukprot:GFUD01081659.1.p1 GENE.GFUD01081659.1~~GFUD01081659.1.p1  ORF type:complete len:107 (-),score=33.47 GFUD01081659.1:3-296(-)
MFFYFAKLMYLSMNVEGLEERETDREDRNKVYFDLLLKMVKRKQHFDHENSIQDDFSDLRQDIQNIVSGKQKSVSQEINELKKIMFDLKKEMISLKK